MPPFIRELLLRTATASLIGGKVGEEVRQAIERRAGKIFPQITVTQVREIAEMAQLQHGTANLMRVNRDTLINEGYYTSASLPGSSKGVYTYEVIVTFDKPDGATDAVPFHVRSSTALTWNEVQEKAVQELLGNRDLMAKYGFEVGSTINLDKFYIISAYIGQ